jgi:hypothetical protein
MSPLGADRSAPATEWRSERCLDRLLEGMHAERPLHPGSHAAACVEREEPRLGLEREGAQRWAQSLLIWLSM